MIPNLALRYTRASKTTFSDGISSQELYNQDMNAVSIILYVAAAFAGLFILTRMVVRALKFVLLVALIVLVLSWVRFSHTPLCSSTVSAKLPQWATPFCETSDFPHRR